MLTILFLSKLVIVCAVLNPPVKQETVESSKKCILSIAEQYFVTRPDVSIFTTDYQKDSDVLSDVVQSEKLTKKYFDWGTFKVNFWDVRKKYSIIVCHDLTELFVHKQLDNLALWNARSKYIIYSFTTDLGVLQKFVDLLWSFYIINAVILLPNNSSNINIYTIYPYANNNCGDFIEPILIDTCTFGTLNKNTNLFPQKVPSNLHLCPVRIRVLIWPPFVLPPDDGIILDDTILNITQGIEVQMMQAIAATVNFTILFSSSSIPHDWGLATIDGNVTGTIKVLREKGADIGMGSFGPTTERRMFCDFSACHMQEKLTWCVPKAREAPRWKNLLEPFRFVAWLSMLLTYLLTSLIIWGLCYLPPKDSSVYTNLNVSLVYVFSAFLGLSANRTPCKISSRISYFTWLIFGLHFVVAYQAKLIGVLMRPAYEHQISTIEEVLKSGMDYQILPTHKRFYSNTDDWKVAKIINEWNPCYDSDECLKRVAYKRDFALCTLKAHAEFEALKYRNSEGQTLIHCIDYVTYGSELYMTKGYPLKDRIDKLIYRVRDSGLMFKWQKDLQWVWFSKYKNTLPQNEGKKQVLTLDHMQGAFAVLILGLVVAGVFFLGEVVFGMLVKPEIVVHKKM